LAHPARRGGWATGLCHCDNDDYGAVIDRETLDALLEDGEVLVGLDSDAVKYLTEWPIFRSAAENTYSGSVASVAATSCSVRFLNHDETSRC
jgi:hypothetical protein